jgi:hypothetical protein
LNADVTWLLLVREEVGGRDGLGIRVDESRWTGYRTRSRWNGRIEVAGRALGDGEWRSGRLAVLDSCASLLQDKGVPGL